LGRAIVEQLGDRRAVAMLVGVYSVVRCFAGGSAIDYVRYGEEAAGIAAECDDPALRAAIGTLPMFAYHFVGDGRAILAWADRVLGGVGSDSGLGKEIFGFSPRAAALQARVHAHVYLGQLEEARRAAKVAAEGAEAAGEQEVLAWSLFAASWVSYAAGIPGLGVEQARRSLAIGEKLDNEMVRVQGYCLLGMGYLTDAQPAAAREALLTSAAIARERRAAVIMLPVIFGALAEAQVALGERGRSPGVGPGRH
jgi:hypothetical protein